MIFKSRFFRAASAFCLALALSVFAFGDTIRLKDGSLIKGRIVSFGNGRFVIVVGSGASERQLNYSASEIESISFDSSTAAANNNTARNTGDSTIITVGQTPKIAPPKETDKTVAAVPKVITSAPSTLPAASKPIEIGVKVLADNTANGWTNSGWVVKKGQKIKISATGRVSLGGGYYTTPNGINSLADKDKLMSDKPTGGLIAVIGDNDNKFMFIGNAYEFTAERDGALFLGINEGNLNDNSGAFDIKVEVSPETGE